MYNSSSAPLTPAEYAFQNEPRFQDQPWSAPAFDELTEVAQYPRPQCLLHVESAKCQCYTQQATPMAMSYNTCRDIVATGYYNPFVIDDGLSPNTTNERGEAGSAPAPSQTPTERPPKEKPWEKVDFIAPPELSPVQLGGAYRNSVRRVPSQPSQPSRVPAITRGS